MREDNFIAAARRAFSSTVRYGAATSLAIGMVAAIATPTQAQLFNADQRQHVRDCALWLLIDPATHAENCLPSRVPTSFGSIAGTGGGTVTFDTPDDPPPVCEKPPRDKGKKGKWGKDHGPRGHHGPRGPRGHHGPKGPNGPVEIATFVSDGGGYGEECTPRSKEPRGKKDKWDKKDKKYEAPKKDVPKFGGDRRGGPKFGGSHNNNGPQNRNNSRRGGGGRF